MKHILSNKNFLRPVAKMQWKNDGFRSLYESVIHPAVIDTINDWKFACKSNYVLVGGLALSYYLKPRETEDIDLIFLSYDDIPDKVFGFKRTRPHAFTHIRHHVEVELLTPEHLKISKSRFEVVFDNSILSDGVKVASPLSLIVMKLNRYSKQDRVDIYNLILYCKENEMSLDVSDYNLNENESLKFNESIELLNENILYKNKHELECKYILENLNTIKLNKKDFNYDVYVSEGGYYEPCFYFGKNIGSKIKKFEDFTFIVKIPNGNVEILEVIGSSSDYKSFNGYEKEKSILIDWLNRKEDNISNLDILRKKWNGLNK